MSGMYVSWFWFHRCGIERTRMCVVGRVVVCVVQCMVDVGSGGIGVVYECVVDGCVWYRPWL